MEPASTKEDGIISQPDKAKGAALVGQPEVDLSMEASRDGSDAKDESNTFRRKRGRPPKQATRDKSSKNLHPIQSKASGRKRQPFYKDSLAKEKRGVQIESPSKTEVVNCSPKKKSERLRLKRQRCNDTKVSECDEDSKKKRLSIGGAAAPLIQEDAGNLVPVAQTTIREENTNQPYVEERSKSNDLDGVLDQGKLEKQRIIACPYCKFECTDTHDLLPHVKDFHSAHLNSNTDKALFRCLYCKTTCMNAKSIRLHMKRCHSVEYQNLDEPEMLKCTEEGCPGEFKTRKLLTYHLSIDHQIVQPKPRKSKAHSVNIEALRERAKKKEEGNVLQGDKGKKLYEKKKKLSLRVASKTKTKHHKSSRLTDCHESCWKVAEASQKFMCSYCTKPFQHHSLMVLHEFAHEVRLKEAEPAKICKCPTCEEEFSNYYQLDKHNQEVHGDKVEPHMCPECGKRFTTSHYVKMHIETVHLKKVKYLCDYCAKAYKHKSGLERHKEAHHTDEKDKKPKRKYTCELCGSIVTTLVGYRQHLKRHEGLKNFVCRHCGRKFGTAGHCKNHEKIHTGEKEFMCPICAKLFNNQGSLYNHLYRYAVHGPVKKVQHYGRKGDTAALRNILMASALLTKDGKEKSKRRKSRTVQVLKEEPTQPEHEVEISKVLSPGDQEPDNITIAETPVTEYVPSEEMMEVTSTDEVTVKEISIGGESEVVGMHQEQLMALAVKGQDQLPSTSEHIQIVQLSGSGDLMEQAKIVVGNEQSLAFIIMQNDREEILEGTDIHIQYENEAGEIVQQVLQLKGEEETC